MSTQADVNAAQNLERLAYQLQLLAEEVRRTAKALREEERLRHPNG